MLLLFDYLTIFLHPIFINSDFYIFLLDGFYTEIFYAYPNPLITIIFHFKWNESALSPFRSHYSVTFS